MALTLVVLLLVTLLLLLPIFVLTRLTTKHNPNSFPPSPPKIPILGNLHQLGSLPHRSLTALSHKHGPLMLLHLGRIPTLIVSSADAAREVLQNHSLIFASRPPFKVAQTLLYGTADMAFAPYSQYWRDARKMCVTHLFSAKMVQSFRRIREEEVDLMIDTISSAAVVGVVDMSEVLNSFANETLCRVVSGKLGKERMKRLRELIEETTSLFGLFHVGDYIPYLGWVDALMGLGARAKRNSRGWDDVLGEVLEDHASRKLEDVDFVDVLLSLQKDPTSDVQITKDNIKALLVDLLAAGTDPPFIFLEWAMAELVRNPEAMKKLQEEVRGVVGGKAKVREEDLSEMSYLKCVLKEVLRMHPPAPLSIPRASMEDCQIQGYNIPIKSRVLINVWAISRDPTSWEEPEEFRPERFAGNPIDFKGNDFQFIPFGAGRRICPGMNFAITIGEIALANLINQFEWELPHGITIENMDMTEVPGLVTRKKEKLNLLVKPYP